MISYVSDIKRDEEEIILSGMGTRHLLGVRHSPELG